MSKFIYGIDLGTTYSCIAYVDQTGRATVVNNMEGTNTTPSVVNFANPSLVVVGQVAKENAVIDPHNTVSLVKTLMGKSDFAINYNGEDKSPEEVSSYILRKLAEDASKLIGSEVLDVVITCPAYFGTTERNATKKAGIMAGLNVIDIISEPTAAALYYGCTKDKLEKTILVYDLGGGTFDVTVMHIDDAKIEVLCSEGSHQLGGKDWDAEIMNYLATQFATSADVECEYDEFEQQDLRLKAEKAKHQLSSREEVPVMVEASGKRERISLSRKTFDEITQGLLNETLEKTDSAIEIARSKGYEIDDIILVGGSTRMPQVTKALVEKYNIEPKILEPNEAVAKGAAIYALGAYEGKVIEWKEKIESGVVDLADEKVKQEAEKYSEQASVSTVAIPALRGKSMKEVVTVATTKSYALRVLADGQEKCCNMIFKNDKMENGAVKVSKSFGTSEDNQEVAELEVYETDFDCEFFEVDEDFSIGEASLELPENLPAGSPIEVTFVLNLDGILEVIGEEKTGNNKIHAKINAKSGTTVSDELVEKIKEKSKSIVVE